VIINPVEHDIVVVGAGPVALSVARALRGHSVAVLAQERRSPPAPQALDARVYALSPGNVAFLRELGVWDAIPPERLCPVHAMRIAGDAGARLDFDAYEAGVATLAWIVEDSWLQHALWNVVAPLVYAPVECRRLRIQADKAMLELADGRTLAAKLVVGADGANSFVRREAGIAAREHEYGQHAVVANFACEKSHRGTAFQWFLAGGAVLALLPLPGDRVSMVWSLPSAQAEQMSDERLAHDVEAASQGMLGALTLVTPSRKYPLRRLAARRVIAPRVALAGDAAHVVHPLAGQGLNLGLQDVRELCEVFASDRDVGDFRLLRRYERARAEPILAMNAVIGGLFGLFGARGGAASFIRNAGLNLTNHLPVVKNLLMRQAMS